MISYLVKFNNLPKDVKDKVSSKEAMLAIGNLEKKYAISLASVVMQVMVKDLQISTLSDFFVKEHSLDKKQAEDLVALLMDKVFFQVRDYLGIEKEDIKFKNENALPVPLDEVPKYYGPQKNKSLVSGTREDKDLKNWMENQKANMSPRNSSFFFSPEDEEEVKMLAKKVAGFSDEANKKEGVKAGLEKLIKNSGVNFTSDDMKKRFEQVLKTYLHGVRNRVDTKQTLIKSVEVGGLGIDNSQADKILNEASKYRLETEQPTLSPVAKIKTPEQIEEEEKAYQANTPQATGVSSGDSDYDFSALISGKAGKTETETKEVETERKEEKKEPTPLKREKSTYVESEKNAEDTDEKDEFIDLTKLENLKDDRAIDIAKKLRAQTRAKGQEEGAINIVQARAAAGADGRVRMEDVKHVPKLTGPIDELREMNVVNFRRLSENPREAVLKIKKKISFLEEESYTKRFEGIKAWRQSPINKLYLEIGQESIINKSPVSVIIDNRRKARKPILSEYEFKAVMDLNKDLRF